ncbi:phage portal protein [Jiella sonneratiae]|uniref:Phage portal protein n=1 Tax=Jiella sonneratiae TaxID=2816856 RepID=A0ABS3J7G3_9HYPH|nr:phage portal protein [Jiella sonneratiae]MBO0904913.1 phage portal protein [Jiella sonneratiae]
MGLAGTIAGWLGAASRPPGESASAAPAEQKSTATVAGTLVFTGRDEGIWTERSYAALSRAGFMQNPVAYRSVRLIGEAAAAIPLVLYDGTSEVAAHRLLDLMRRPNPMSAGAAFVETLCGHLLLAGNAYVEAALLDGEVKALHVLRPDRVRLIADTDGWPEAFEYRAGTTVRRIAAEAPDGGPASILQLSLFHPLDDHRGYPPLGAAQSALDLHNAAARWNRALLDNSARPSGALIYKAEGGGNLSPDQFDRLKAELETGYSGAARAGRPLLLEGGLDWKAMALSPKDMDFVEAKNGAARDIALAFGVPPMLLGIPGDLTYANYAEANRALYRLTVLPLVKRIAGALGGWLGAHFGEPELSLSVDLDAVEGLSAEREALWTRVGAADFLSRDEKREAVGYGSED